jgi:hypothetical protein
VAMLAINWLSSKQELICSDHEKWKNIVSNIYSMEPLEEIK